MGGDPAVLEVSGIAVRVRRSRRARRLALRLSPRDDHAELVLPPRASLAEGRRFAELRSGWLERRLAQLPPRVAFADGAVVPVLGVPHRLRHQPGAAGRVRREGGEIVVPGARAGMERRVEAWLRRQARRELVARAGAAARRLGREACRVSVRDQATRWGSCSARGALSFSWRLILAPETVLDYVVAHEAAHLAEMNHGPRFWALVAELCPDADAARGWLRRHGARLRRYG